MSDANEGNEEERSENANGTDNEYQVAAALPFCLLGSYTFLTVLQLQIEQKMMLR